MKSVYLALALLLLLCSGAAAMLPGENETVAEPSPTMAAGDNSSAAPDLPGSPEDPYAEPEQLPQPGDTSAAVPSCTKAAWESALLPTDAAGRPLYAPDSIIVQFQPGVAEDISLMATADDWIHTRHRTSLRHDFSEDGLAGLQVVGLPDDLSVSDAVEAYRQDPAVLYAEPNYYCYPDRIPNDLYFSYLWGLRNTGQTVGGQTGTAGADIAAPGAWDITTGSRDVVVAVIDSGVYQRHLDLVDNLWRNPGETADGTDTDGNGYVDDLYGWDFYDNDNDPDDLNGHGTHCAGTIAAIGNNDLGVAGVIWTATIMPLRFSGPDGTGTISGAISAIAYAKNNGADIISNSWGTASYSASLKQAIDSFDGVITCSAGNDAANTDSSPNYPASFNSSHIIAVASTDNRNALSTFSNYGATTVDLAAPGTGIYSTSIYFDRQERFSDAMATLNNWSVSGAWGLNTTVYRSSPASASDNPFGNATSAGEFWLKMKNNVTLGDYCLPEVSFWCNYSLTAANNTLGIYASSPTVAGTYYPIGGLRGSSNGAWRENTISAASILSTYKKKGFAKVPKDLKFVFILERGNTTAPDYVFIDDVSVTEVTQVLPDYGYKSGTSMATPHVAGLAGLLKAYNASLTTSQVCGIILGTVDPLPALANKTVTGGRINATEALSVVYLNASLTANRTSGTAPLTVAFNDTSTGVNYTCLWSFGDGNTSVERHPVFTYTTNGTFTVNLTITNAYGGNTTSQTDIVTVTAPAEPTPTATPTTTPTATPNVTPTVTPTPTPTHGPPHSWVTYLGTETVRLAWPDSSPLKGTPHDGGYSVYRDGAGRVWKDAGTSLVDYKVPGSQHTYEVFCYNKTAQTLECPFGGPVTVDFGRMVGGDLPAGIFDVWDADGGTLTLFKDTRLSDQAGSRLQIRDATLVAENGTGITGSGSLILDDAALSGVLVDISRGGSDNKALSTYGTVETDSPIVVEDSDLLLENIASTSSLDVTGERTQIRSCTGMIAVTGNGTSISGCGGEGYAGISVKGENAVIEDNVLENIWHTLYDERYGIWLSDGSGSIIRNNTITNVTAWSTWGDGIRIGTVRGNPVENITLEDNRIDGVTGVGVRMHVDTPLLTIRGNAIRNTTHHGIYADRESTVPATPRFFEICDNTIDTTGTYGIYLAGSNGYIENNTLTNVNAAIRLHGDGCAVCNNSITAISGAYGLSGAEAAIAVYGDDAVIGGNAVAEYTGVKDYGLQYGIRIDGADGILRNNTVERYFSGLDVIGANHTVTGNVLDTIAGTTMYHHVVNFAADASLFAENTIINTTQPSWARGVVYVAGVGESTFRSNTIDSGKLGFYCAKVGNGTVIEENVLTNMTSGVYLYQVDGGDAITGEGPSDLQICNNTIAGKNEQWSSGISIDRVDGVRISGNAISDFASGIETYQLTKDTLIAENTVERGSQALSLKGAGDRVIENSFCNYTSQGVYLENPAGTLLENNTILNAGETALPAIRVNTYAADAFMIERNTVGNMTNRTTFSITESSNGLVIKPVLAPPAPPKYPDYSVNRAPIGQWLDINTYNAVRSEDFRFNLTFHYAPEDLIGVGAESLSVWRHNTSRWDAGGGDAAWNGTRWLDTTACEVGVQVTGLPPYTMTDPVVFAPLGNMPVHNLDLARDYETITEALADGDLGSGHTIVVDSGYAGRENLQIGKSVNLLATSNLPSDVRVTAQDPAKPVVEVIGESTVIAGFVFEGATSAEGVLVDGGTSITIRDCTVRGNREGVVIQPFSAYTALKSANCSILGTTVTENTLGGVLIVEGSGHTVQNCILSDPRLGIGLENTTESRISGNTLAGCDEKGIWILGGSGNTVAGNSLTGGDQGIVLDRTDASRLQENTVSSAAEAGITILGSHRAALTTENVSASPVGILLDGADDATLTGCRVTGAAAGSETTGILIRDSDRTSLVGCRIAEITSQNHAVTGIRLAGGSTAAAITDTVIASVTAPKIAGAVVGSGSQGTGIADLTVSDLAGGGSGVVGVAVEPNSGETRIARSTMADLSATGNVTAVLVDRAASAAITKTAIDRINATGGAACGVVVNASSGITLENLTVTRVAGTADTAAVALLSSDGAAVGFLEVGDAHPVLCNVTATGSVRIDGVETPPTPPEGLQAIGRFLAIGNATPAEAAVRVYYTAADLGGASPSSLRIWRHADVWSRVEGATGVDTANQFVYATTDEFGVFGPLAEPLSVDFSANRTSGATPLAVQFSDASTGSPTAWSWSFGDGATSTEQHPVHTYAAAGNYTVTLTINGGGETCTRPAYVRVTPVLFGDANGDDAVNQADTLRVLKEVVGLVAKPVSGTGQFQKTDVHANGVVEVGDALFIAQYNAGLRDVWFAIA
ncbi:PKD domain-containing protein [Methanoculleus sp. FWC-SCC1]|uniref:PKD domain-containing protein n=1 Tax=Methanoculleus frigidifontis TaxID=2584085 RepID=A0ABT8M7B3_9EURY|nr:right-handed parallel beta-helix repeat-containing protein [Methanoculleus sp. FWC-SCC1]MDN7023825.1 PKD domain-containing protein [Methanoculleus sp. FWC-SCC1]